MWYPGKFWRNLSYSCVDGRLREELRIDRRPGLKHRRRWRMAFRRDAGYAVAVIDGAGCGQVDGWQDTIDHRFRSVTLRFEGAVDSDVAWVRTTTRPRRFFRSDPAVRPDDPNPVSVDIRSGPMLATWSEVDGRFVEVLQPIDGTIDASRLRLVPLGSVVPSN